MIIIFHTWNK